jgi:hypothetical protein
MSPSEKRMVAGIALCITFFVPAYAVAFHEGGVGYCAGCHDTHDSQDRNGGASRESTASSGTWILRGADASSTCLRCHAEENKAYSILSKDGSQFTPGGDFYWLKRSYNWVNEGKSNNSDGMRHGHNVVASQYGLHADSRLASAPGGTFSASHLGCTSCHDPHARSPQTSGGGRPISASGSYGKDPDPGTVTGSYRLLGGVGYTPAGGVGTAPFVYGAPIAVAPSLDWSETDSNHPAYGSGMSRWCANCHAAFVNGMGSHPSGVETRLGEKMAVNYNAYVRTGDHGGSPEAAYSALVPFELGVSDRAMLDPSSRSGPGLTGSANVMCLTCHRAHASAFQGMGRWDFEATFLADSHPKNGDTGVVPQDVRNSYYGRDMAVLFGKYQRQLCNKCHAKD